MRKYFFFVTAIICILLFQGIVSALSSSGEQKTIIILVNFNNVNVACTPFGVSNMVFDTSNSRSITNYYKGASLDHTWFTGNVVGPITIPYAQDTSTSCAYSTWSASADSILQASGIDLSPYTRRVYSFPTACGKGGIGQYPSGSFTRTWTFYCSGKGNLVHEFGHNLGMRHASTPTNEYGDTSDPMGSGWGPSGSNYDWLVTLNGPHYNQMISSLWFPANKVITLTTGTTGSYDIAPLEYTPSQTTLPQVIRISKKDTNEYYYLTYRRAIGYDSDLTTTYTDKLNIHRIGSANSYFLSSLTDNGVFTDTINGIKVTSLSHTLDSSKVFVNISGTPCASAAPTVTLTPTAQVATTAGKTLSYSGTLKNNADSTCSADSFTLTSAVPTGFVGSLSQNSLTLASGTTASFSISVTSPSTVTNGNYPFTVTSTATLNPTQSASATYSYAQDTQAPTAPTNVAAKSSTSRGKKGTTRVTVTWNAATDNTGVSQYIVFRNGMLAATLSGTTLSFTDSSVVKGTTYSYYVQAKDAAGNASPNSNTATVVA